MKPDLADIETRLADLLRSYLETSSPEELRQASRLIGAGEIDRKPLISHTFSLEKASEAYETQLREEETIKVVLTP